MTVAGRYFPPRGPHPVAAYASVPARRVLRIEMVGGETLSERPARGLRATARLAGLTRRLDLADGARFETEDNDGADALLWKLWRLPRGVLTAWLEHRWQMVAVALLLILTGGYVFAVAAAPVVVERLAKMTLRAMAHPMSEQTLLTLDKDALRPTSLSPAEQEQATSLFAKAETEGRGGPGGYRLIFRGGSQLGPNAFALPDGTVVMTDKLWGTIKDDDEALGVFAHEISHVDHAHQLQRVYEVALWPALVATLTGDISRMSEMASNLPGLIAQSPVPDNFERQADDDAATMMLAMGARPSHLAALLQRLDRSACSGDYCPLAWVNDHPETVERVARLRAQDDDAEACAGAWTGRLTLRCLGLR